jgi:nucleotide-binding universal stress UspA family protein
MKTILVPTDYREPAANALRYAADLARFLPARILICHVYQIPIPFPGDMPALLVPTIDFEKPLREQLDACVQEFRETSGRGLEVDSLLIPGTTAEEVSTLAREKKADFVVLGSGKDSHRFFGDVITGILETCDNPVLIIPEQVRFSVPSKLALACKYGDGVPPPCMEKVKDLVSDMHAELFVINIENPEELHTEEKILSSERIDQALKGVQHSFYFPVHANVVEGLLAFEDAHRIDMLIMLSRRHGFLSQLFYTSTTRKMTLKSTIPVLLMCGEKRAAKLN